MKNKLTTKTFFNNCFDKRKFQNFLYWFFKKNRNGQSKLLKFLEKLKFLGFHSATEAGFSISIEDLKIPRSKSAVLLTAKNIAFNADLQLSSATLTNIEHYQRIIEMWNRTSEKLKYQLIQSFEISNFFNPVYLMAFSGARGNISQIRQLVGMRGLMADPQGQIIDFPIRSNFREGLTLTEYLISCSGARKGIVDTALRTAASGYLTRRLVDVAHHVIVNQIDCQSNLYQSKKQKRQSRGILIKDLYDQQKKMLPLQQRLIGRILAETIVSHEKNLIIGKKNQEISHSISQKICKYRKQVFVRSPLTCNSPKFVCQLCYGWNLAEGQLVSIGEAIGILAAQSIGEPGTQLTMRTFHTGGVFTGKLVDQTYSPFSGYIKYINFYPGLLIRTQLGKVAYLVKSNGILNIEIRLKQNQQKKIKKFARKKQLAQKKLVNKLNIKYFFLKKSLSVFDKQNRNKSINSIFPEKSVQQSYNFNLIKFTHYLKKFRLKLKKILSLNLFKLQQQSTYHKINKNINNSKLFSKNFHSNFSQVFKNIELKKRYLKHINRNYFLKQNISTFFTSQIYSHNGKKNTRLMEFSFQSATLLYVKQGEKIERTQLLAELPTISKDILLESEQEILSQTSGEVYFENFILLEKTIFDLKNEIYRTKIATNFVQGLGEFWILFGQSLNFDSIIHQKSAFFKKSDLINGCVPFFQAFIIPYYYKEFESFKNNFYLKNKFLQFEQTKFILSKLQFENLFYSFQLPIINYNIFKSYVHYYKPKVLQKPYLLTSKIKSTNLVYNKKSNTEKEQKLVLQKKYKTLQISSIFFKKSGYLQVITIQSNKMNFCQYKKNFVWSQRKNFQERMNKKFETWIIGFQFQSKYINYYSNHKNQTLNILIKNFKLLFPTNFKQSSFSFFFSDTYYINSQKLFCEFFNKKINKYSKNIKNYFIFHENSCILFMNRQGFMKFTNQKIKKFSNLYLNRFSKKVIYLPKLFSFSIMKYQSQWLKFYNHSSKTLFKNFFLIQNFNTLSKIKNNKYIKNSNEFNLMDLRFTIHSKKKYLKFQNKFSKFQLFLFYIENQSFFTTKNSKKFEIVKYLSENFSILFCKKQNFKFFEKLLLFKINKFLYGYNFFGQTLNLNSYYFWQLKLIFNIFLSKSDHFYNPINIKKIKYIFSSFFLKKSKLFQNIPKNLSRQRIIYKPKIIHWDHPLNQKCIFLIDFLKNLNNNISQEKKLNFAKTNRKKIEEKQNKFLYFLFRSNEINNLINFFAIKKKFISKFYFSIENQKIKFGDLWKYKQRQKILILQKLKIGLYSFIRISFFAEFYVFQNRKYFLNKSAKQPTISIVKSNLYQTLNNKSKNFRKFEQNKFLFKHIKIKYLSKSTIFKYINIYKMKYSILQLTHQIKLLKKKKYILIKPRKRKFLKTNTFTNFFILRFLKIYKFFVKDSKIYKKIEKTNISTVEVKQNINLKTKNYSLQHIFYKQFKKNYKNIHNQLNHTNSSSNFIYSWFFWGDSIKLFEKRKYFTYFKNFVNKNLKSNLNSKNIQNNFCMIFPNLNHFSEELNKLTSNINVFVLENILPFYLSFIPNSNISKNNTSQNKIYSLKLQKNILNFYFDSYFSILNNFIFIKNFRTRFSQYKPKKPIYNILNFQDKFVDQQNIINLLNKNLTQINQIEDLNIKIKNLPKINHKKINNSKIKFKKIFNFITDLNIDVQSLYYLKISKKSLKSEDFNDQLQNFKKNGFEKNLNNIKNFKKYFTRTLKSSIVSEKFNFFLKKKFLNVLQEKNFENNKKLLILQKYNIKHSIYFVLNFSKKNFDNFFIISFSKSFFYLQNKEKFKVSLFNKNRKNLCYFNFKLFSKMKQMKKTILAYNFHHKNIYLNNNNTIFKVPFIFSKKRKSKITLISLKLLINNNFMYPKNLRLHFPLFQNKYKMVFINIYPIYKNEINKSLIKVVSEKTNYVKFDFIKVKYLNFLNQTNFNKLSNFLFYYNQKFLSNKKTKNTTHFQIIKKNNNKSFETQIVIRFFLPPIKDGEIINTKAKNQNLTTTSDTKKNYEKHILFINILDFFSYKKKELGIIPKKFSKCIKLNKFITKFNLQKKKKEKLSRIIQKFNTSKLLKNSFFNKFKLNNKILQIQQICCIRQKICLNISLKNYTINFDNETIELKKKKYFFETKNKQKYLFLKLGSMVKNNQEFYEFIFNTGQLIGKTKKFFIFRKASINLLNNQNIVYIKNNEIISKNQPLYNTFYRQSKTGDIVQGIPKIEEIFEARKKFKYNFKELSISFKDFVYLEKKITNYLQNLQISVVNNIQRIYCGQGIYISDKHIEIIVRQMTANVLIIEPGYTGLLYGETVSLQWVEKINKKLISNYVLYEPILIGMTKTCIETSSFLSAASFQETTKVLSKAALQNQIDFIRGLKQNVILGNLIPIGTGYF